MYQHEHTHVFSNHLSDTKICSVNDASRPRFAFLSLQHRSASTLSSWFSGSDRRWVEDQSVLLNKKQTCVIQPWAGLWGEDEADVTGVAMSNHPGLSAFNRLSSPSCLGEFYFPP